MEFLQGWERRPVDVADMVYAAAAAYPGDFATKFEMMLRLVESELGCGSREAARGPSVTDGQSGQLIQIVPLAARPHRHTGRHRIAGARAQLVNLRLRPRARLPRCVSEHSVPTCHQGPGRTARRRGSSR
jgi:hypothetical protein